MSKDRILLVAIQQYTFLCTLFKLDRYVPDHSQSFEPRFCACWGVPANLVPALIKDPQWKAVAVIYGKWKACVQRFVEAKQEAGVFGHSSASSSAARKPLDEFEVDETCVRKRDLGDDTVEWTEYVGMKRRGDPQSLYLEQRSLDKCKSKRKSNGGVSPPPYTKEWLALAAKKVCPGALQHSDGAKACQQDLEGVELRQSLYKKWWTLFCGKQCRFFFCTCRRKKLGRMVGESQAKPYWHYCCQ